MLSLQIKLGGDVFIGDDVRIVVRNIDSKQNTVELQFHAPREIKILRGYLYRRGEGANRDEERHSEQ